MKKPRFALALVVTAAALSAGCVIQPVGPRYVDDGPVVSTAPPAPQYEVVGVAPAVGMVWLAGHWGWMGSRYHWHPGHWAQGRAGHRWVPHAWERGRGGWVHRPGYWRRG